ncbi:metalloregulator ArsR/SmtB family transcription factor [Breoghania sp. L-A4]|uniref:ArsR/SmtB family transcription factor n=1 Tax=Breoghania sp. L-A4 TaxID=2304600 RepID=UPI000E35F6E7|nr:metalloregulator ArsR/SmtB family transcription factor [Breoghania sp. L-A4]AXS40332.1 transcriptional regulator [Breoghania sp. L-A4]
MNIATPPDAPAASGVPDAEKSVPIILAGASQAPGALDDERLAAVFKALGHPARLAILREIRPRERACCGEIVKALPLAQSTVSQHLQILRDAGLITGEIEGRRSHYCIDADTIDALARACAFLFGDLARSADQCAVIGDSCHVDAGETCA